MKGIDHDREVKGAMEETKQVLCAHPSDVIREDAVSALFFNNRVQAMRILSMRKRTNRSTFATNEQGQTMLSPMSLPIRAVLLGGRYTPNFPAAVIDVPDASVVMFETAVQILGTRDEWSAQQVMESLCYRMNISLGLTDLAPCKRYVCNLVSAFGLGHGIDMNKACDMFPSDRIVYKPAHFDGLEVSMQEKDEGSDRVKITCTLFSTGSGVFTGGTRVEHHLKHLRKLVPMMYKCAVPLASDSGHTQASGNTKGAPKKRKRGKRLYVFPQSFLDRDPSIPAPITLPAGIYDEQDGKKTTRTGTKKRRTSYVSQETMKLVMDGVPLHHMDPQKPFYTPLPGRSVIRDPRSQTVTYWYTEPGPAFCDHTQVDPTTGKPVFRVDANPPFCSACQKEARPFKHPRHHAQSGHGSNVCTHTSCSLTLREMGPGVVLPECDSCGHTDVTQRYFSKRVERQNKAEEAHTRRMHDKRRAETRVLKPATVSPQSSVKAPQSTRQEVAQLMKSYDKQKRGTNRYTRLTLTTQSLLSATAQKFTIL